MGKHQPGGRELVLDYIVERKRMDDLVHSCTDGRLPDQKVSRSWWKEQILWNKQIPWKKNV